MKLPVLNIKDVAELQLCCGCGACAAACPDEIEMVDVLDHGRRPRFRNGAPGDSGSETALQVCPGAGLQHETTETPDAIEELRPAWGPILEVWEGHASDPDIRYHGSSGGVASALAFYCIEAGGMHGLLHIAARPDVPYLNHTVLSTSRDEILAATGSRYAPASPCDGLGRVEAAPAPCVFIGKPCDVAAASKLRKLRPALDEKLGLTIGIFCAGTPTTRGTLEMLKVMGVDNPRDVEHVRYRGRGWPGNAAATVRTGNGLDRRELSYEQSWGEILQKHRQWRCYVCADHSGEFADIAVGDPWYRKPGAGEAGQSLVLVRTERGRRILHAAMDTGYLTLAKADPQIVAASQPNLLKTRGAVWGRIQALRLLGAPAPRFDGMPMFRHWWRQLSFKQKCKSFYGTFKRIVTKKLRKRHAMTPFAPVPPEADGAPEACEVRPVSCAQLETR